ncbi:MAG TPA: NAD(P)H-binding protein [Gammaproteobacteria bacterium]|nr:NAD(P)H-binding protein [Gammaproteobacteria bacterium]
MKLIITGGSGQLARRAAELLLAKIAPQDVIVTTRTPAGLRSLAERGVIVRQADFAAPQTLRAAFAGAERMLLVSATDLVQRTAQHRAAIEAAKAAGVRHVVYTSGLRPEPPNPAVVAPSHYATEQALMQSGMAWTILRNSLYADYQIPEASQAIAAGALVHNRGAGKVAYVARDDCAAVAAAVLVAAGQAGKCYDVTGPKAYAAAELAAMYAELGGRPVIERRVDDAELVASIVGGAGGDDHLRYGAELVASFGRSIREGYMDACTDHVAKLTARPARSLRDVLGPLRAARG